MGQGHLRDPPSPRGLLMEGGLVTGIWVLAFCQQREHCFSLKSTRAAEGALVSVWDHRHPSNHVRTSRARSREQACVVLGPEETWRVVRERWAGAGGRALGHERPAGSHLGEAP